MPVLLGRDLHKEFRRESGGIVKAAGWGEACRRSTARYNAIGRLQTTRGEDYAHSIDHGIAFCRIGGAAGFGCGREG